MTPEEAARVVLDYDAEATDALLFPLKECAVCGRRRPNVETYFERQHGLLSSVCRDCRDANRRKGKQAVRSRSRREDIGLAADIIADLRRRGMRNSEIARAIGHRGGLHVLLAQTTVSRQHLEALVELSESMRRSS